MVHVYADDIVLCSTRSEVVEKKLEEWRRAMEDRGLKINRTKTVYLRFNVEIGWKLRYQSTGTEFGTSEYKYLGRHWLWRLGCGDDT